MTTRSRRRGRFTGRKKVSYGWLNFSLFNATLTDGGLLTADLLGALTLVEKNDVRSVVRVIWSFFVRSATAGNRASGRFGMIVVTDDAMAASAVPDPLGDPLDAWYLNTGFFQEDAANVPVEQRGDLRSARRLLGDGQTIAFVAESDLGSSSGSMLITFMARVLYSKT